MQHLGPARLIALTLVLALGCSGRLVPLAPSSAILLPQAQSQDVVRAAIARAMAGREYVAESEEPGRIIARYQRRGSMLRLQIDYTDTQYQITYLDSQGFGHRVDRNGQTMINGHYPRQIRALTESIDSELGRPEREAAEAEARERQHQIALAQQETARQQAAIDAQRSEAQARRNAQLEAERLRTERARAEAEARRPVVVAPPQAVVVPQQAPRALQPAYGYLGRFNQSYAGQAGGHLSAQDLRLPGSCVGFFADAPSHTVRFDRQTYARLYVQSNIDTVLAVVSDDGTVWCDDDGGGNMNPLIQVNFPASTYYVWVGSYRPNQITSYQLSLLDGSEQQQAIARAPSAPPPPSRDPQCTQAMINAGYTSRVQECVGVETQCALSMINAGYASRVSQCRDVEPQCAQAMIQAGYASRVEECVGVEPQCAVAMIQRGYASRVTDCR